MRCRRGASLPLGFRCPVLPAAVSPVTWCCRSGAGICLEVKARADGFRELYGWLEDRDVLIVKADRREPLVVVRLSLAAEISQAANWQRTHKSGAASAAR
jgi:hypothetical protein